MLPSSWLLIAFFFGKLPLAPLDLDMAAEAGALGLLSEPAHPMEEPWPPAGVQELTPSVGGVPTSWQHDYHFSFVNTEPLYVHPSLSCGQQCPSELTACQKALQTLPVSAGSTNQAPRR